MQERVDGSHAGTAAWERPGVIALPRLAVWCTPLALYLVALVALLTPWLFAAHPAWAYNWEEYTAWRLSTYWESPEGPSREIWAPTDGLMTDSGQGPLVGLPAALGMALDGHTITAMRVPVSLLAAAAVPLLWLLARMTTGGGAAAFAALLLAVSPAYLIYGRTATLVGISLVPLLLTAIALVRVLDAPAGTGWRWRREGLLAATLLGGIYAYAPVRLLWPLVLLLLGFAAWRGRERRGHLVRTVVLCVLIVPGALALAEQFAAPDPDPLAAVLGYFHARGEQLVALREDPVTLTSYLREDGVPPEDAWGRAWLLVRQNTSDLGRLLLDRETASVLTDYWNPMGRLWPWFLGPWAVIGAVWSIRSAWRDGRTALVVPVALAAGLTLPLLLTTRVHVGRLLPAFPFALLLAAAGVWAVSRWLGRVFRTARAPMAARVVAPWLGLMVLLPTVAVARNDLAASVPPSPETMTAAALAAWYPEVERRGGAVLVEAPKGDEIERVHVAAYQLELDPHYRFIDLQRREAVETGGRPPLYWHDALGALAAGMLSGACERLWFVAPDVNDAFLAAWRRAGCAGAPASVTLP
ncbi:MAG: glycosyltransferase family 39 protein [Thermomicrobiales bacterium]